MNSNSFTNITLNGQKTVLVDSGATDNFISEQLLKRMKIGKLILQKLQTIWSINGMHNKARTIKYFVDLQVQVGLKIEEMKFLVTDLGEDKIILGYPWLAAFQPKINWKEATIAEDMQPIVIKTLGLKMDKEVVCIAKMWTEFTASMSQHVQLFLYFHFIYHVYFYSQSYD